MPLQNNLMPPQWDPIANLQRAPDLSYFLRWYMQQWSEIRSYSELARQMDIPSSTMQNLFKPTMGRRWRNNRNFAELKGICDHLGMPPNITELVLLKENEERLAARDEYNRKQIEELLK